MIVKVNEETIYNTAREFLERLPYEELKEVFEKHTEEYFKGVAGETLKKQFEDGESEELTDTIFDHLNSFGWSDQEIIEEVLKNREEEYLIHYMPENHGQGDYFHIFELEE